MRGLVCGPKQAACGMVLSLWGVIMLVSTTGLLFVLPQALMPAFWMGKSQAGTTEINSFSF